MPKAILFNVLILAVSISGAAAAQEGLATKPAPAKVQSDAELDTLAGGRSINTTMALTEQDLTSVNTGNTITAGTVGSGSITLRDNAFANFNGVGNVIMNTGHNNNLQASMSVTVIITPAAP